MANVLAASGLPRYALVKSNHNSKFVCHRNDSINGHLRANEDDSTIPNCKFELEMAETGGGLVHIRSCYNNKYWRRRSSGNSYIVAGADQRNEDKSHPACTLFELIRDKVDAKTFQLRVVSTNRNVGLRSSTEEASLLSLYANFADENHRRTKFTVMDWESLLILPKRVAFKGDNGKYLRIEHRRGYPWVKFYGEEIVIRSVSNDITNGPDGSVRIKSNDNNKFWRRSPNWIWADSTDNTNKNKDTLFMPVRAGFSSNAVALRSLGNNRFCKRLTTDGWIDCLNAATPDITPYAILSVEEPVFSRSIYNVVYRLEDARVYNENIITLVTRVATNNNTEPETHEVSLSYTTTTTRSWGRGVSVGTTVSTSFSAKVPFIASGSVDVSTSFEGSFSWDDTEEESDVVTVIQTLTVPPKSRLRASVVATRGNCDVPFSYTQRDVRTDGVPVTYNMNDGFYTGANSYNFHYETSAPEPL